MVQKELYNVRGPPQEKFGGGGNDRREKERLTSPFVLYLIEPDGNSHPQMVSSSPRIKSPSSSMFLIPIQSSLTSTLTFVKLIKT